MFRTAPIQAETVRTGSPLQAPDDKELKKPLQCVAGRMFGAIGYKVQDTSRSGSKAFLLSLS